MEQLDGQKTSAKAGKVRYGDKPYLKVADHRRAFYFGKHLWPRLA